MYIVHKQVFVSPTGLRAPEERAHFSIHRSSSHHSMHPQYTYSYPWSHMIRYGPHCSASLKAQGHFMDSQCDQFVAAPLILSVHGVFFLVPLPVPILLTRTTCPLTPRLDFTWKHSSPSPIHVFPQAPRGCLETGTSPTMDSYTFISA